MCTIPPPPPPPPHPNVNCTSTVTTPVEAYCPNLKSSVRDLCQWASSYPELQEACIRNYNCLHQPPYEYRYKYFTSIAQRGPTCGLVALSMMVNGVIPQAEIFCMAKNDGYTNIGEMFSAKNMLRLGKKVLQLADKGEVDLELHNGKLFTENMIEKLLNGCAMLVPYDADAKHCPCLAEGRDAHWALVCGVMIPQAPSGDCFTANPDNVFVFCKHGNSRYLATWRLYDLSKSNMNLWEFSKKRLDEVLVVPKGGLAGKHGLRYDADFNHSPCLQGGHKAHWALVCGVLILQPPGDCLTDDPDNVFVFCKHGKSKYLAIWKLFDLSKSNKNLWEFSKRRGDDGQVYVLPEGGVGGKDGLRNQFVIVTGL